MSAESKISSQYSEISRLNPDDVRRYVKNQMENLELLLKSIDDERKIVKIIPPPTEEKYDSLKLADKKLFSTLSCRQLNELTKKKCDEKVVETIVTKKRKCNSDDNESSKKIKDSSRNILSSEEVSKIHPRSYYRQKYNKTFRAAVENGEQFEECEIELHQNGYTNYGPLLKPVGGKSDMDYLRGIDMAVCGNCTEYAASGIGMLRHYQKSGCGGSRSTVSIKMKMILIKK
jgi:hypothetical protein